MISDEDVKQLFSNAHSFLTNQNNSGPLLTQFYRGRLPDNWKNQPSGACNRHIALFKHFNIIPKYCFSCYKVIIEPRTVIELFKMMMIFEMTTFPNDNTRKCLVEGRPKITGTYKGMVYCRSIEEGEVIIQMLQPILSEEISKNIPITIKRGCSEFALSYPDYAKIEQGTTPMEYKNEWQKHEDRADKSAVVNKIANAKDTHNRPTYVLDDYKVMLTWLKYAATIGDNSYLKISGDTLPPFQGLTRPVPFQSIDDVK
ncbi:MAG: hypothetical protein OEY06_01720 [Gammaproteobacteria bacterium]|nr:hypothetical protein [Gammaproteobacteria bacterium]